MGRLTNRAVAWWLMGCMVVATALVTVSGIRRIAKADEDEHGNKCMSEKTETRLTNDIPTSILPPTNECLQTHVVGKGDQIYTCTAGAWKLKAPEAYLTQEDKFVGYHSLGPSWVWGKDGSQVRGTLVKQVTPDPTSIPWLLLTATVVDNSFHGKLSTTTHIVRAHTIGGLAPPLPCVENAEVRSGYSADYLFYGLAP